MLTHNDTISSDTCRPGYVSYDCGTYNLPDNTAGKVGLHHVYRPLCSGYAGHEHMTAALRQLAREHMDLCRAAAAEAKAEAEARKLADIKALCAAPVKPERSVAAGGLCPRCNDYCYGDCNN